MTNRHRQEGQELAEFALLLPLILVLVLGVLDLGRAMHTYIALKNVSRAGARYASLRADPATVAGVQTQVLAEASVAGISDLQARQVTVRPGDASRWGDGTAVTVTVTYPFQLLSAIPVGQRTISMTASTAMMVIGAR